MLCLKIRNINPWEYLVYTIGLSVSFIMFAGLAVNWILPFLNITDKPLLLYPILICFDTILLALWLVAQRRNEDNVHLLIFPFEEYNVKGKPKFKLLPKFPSLSWLDRIFIIVPFFFPFMAVIGAFLLNNHGTNIVTMIMLGAIAVYVFLVVLFRDKLNENVFPWALWMIGLSLLLMFSMRSWYISGYDIHAEYKISLKSLEGYWDINGFKNAYNFCLSITILPSILTNFTFLGTSLIFKLVFPLIFSLISIILFSLSKLYFKKTIIFIGVFFFVSQSQFFYFYSWARQEIALIFFGLMLLVLFSKEINPKIKNLLFVIFGFSMIVSHYSTSYIALALFLITYILILIYKLWENRKIKKGKLKSEQKEQFYLTGVLILLLLIFGFLWYSQVTTTANGLIDFVHKSISNLGNMFSEEAQAEGQSPFQYFNVFKKSSDNSPLLNNYSESVKRDYSSLDIYPKSVNKDYAITQVPYTYAPAYLSQAITSKIYYLLIIIKKFLEFIILPGTILIFFHLSKKEYSFFGILSSLFLVILVLLPFFSINYNLSRTYQQFLIILFLSGVFLLYYILNKFHFKEALIILIYITYFLLMTGFISQFIGGSDGLPQLNNFGSLYETAYTFKSEVISASYFSIIPKSNGSLIYGDTFSKARLTSFSTINKKIFVDIFPFTVTKNSYIFLRYQNSINGGGGLPSENPLLKRISVNYNFPTEFLNDNKNKIYNNGGSEIFK